MDEKELRTSPKQRFFIILIAVLMVGSIVASYAAIVASGGSTSTDTNSVNNVDKEKIAQYEEAYNEVAAEFSEATRGDFDEFIKYKSEITAYNESSANNSGVQTKDLELGTGRELVEGDNNYLAYYVGWCADESVFDSSFDNNNNPTAFAKILNASSGMIEGWNIGIEGMKLGGVREITIPGELAYGSSMEICGGMNKPLKFMVMTKANEGSLAELATKLDDAYMRLNYAYYGVDYDSIKANTE